MANISYRFEEFLGLSFENFMSHISLEHHDAHVSLSSLQTVASKNEFDDLQFVLKGRTGRVLFEYSIPNLSKTIDVVLLTQNKVFVLQYKAGARSYDGPDIRQVNGYALRLKYFHSQSNDRWVIPILVATDACIIEFQELFSEEDTVFSPIRCNSSNLSEALDYINSLIPGKSDVVWEDQWEEGIFKASPTIIDAARNVWKQNNVRGFKVGESSRNKRQIAEKFIINTVVEETKKRKGKSICFVTGVPGAGKTLVGLNISVQLQDVGASLISGNGPLVAVLTQALKNDLKKYSKQLVRPKNDVSVETIIRGAYGYKKEIFDRRLDYEVGVGTVRLKENAEKSEQHVMIFDEAQRAWNKEKLIDPGRSGRKEWQEDAFPFSEPGLLLWDLNQRDWAVCVCLVGGGQEINTGESGICEWLRSIKENPDFNDWHIYISDQLTDPVYDSKSGDGETLLSYKNYFFSCNRLTVDPSLHLTACQRSNRTERVSAYVQALLNCEADAAKEIYDAFKNRYQIWLTRDLDKAKEKVRERQRTILDRVYNGEIEESEIRIGMLMSSRAARLRPLGYRIIKVTEYLDKVHHWFLDSSEYVDSSNYLELAMNEFFVQGLELDFTVVMWDADFRYDPCTNEWKFFKFNGRKWTEVARDPAHEIERFYMMNAYRVLLTRARAGMVIYVPCGSKHNQGESFADPTRDALFYDNTYLYLKSTGLSEL